MCVFATAGGPGQAMDVLPLCGCWLGTALIAFFALFAVVRRSIGWSVAAVSAAVYQTFAAWVMVVIDKPPANPDPDELPVEGLVWKLVVWSSLGLVIAGTSLLWVIGGRKKPRPADPQPPKPSE